LINVDAIKFNQTKFQLRGEKFENGMKAQLNLPEGRLGCGQPSLSKEGPEIKNGY